MARRGENIYKRKDGRWEGRYRNGYKADGHIKYSSVYGKSYSVVKALLVTKKHEITGDLPCSFTIKTLTEHWLDNIKVKVKESTYMNYLTKAEKHIFPALGEIMYDKLTVQKINDFVRNKYSEGLSDKYISDILAVLKSVCRFAGKVYGFSNKSEYIELPKSKKRSEKSLLDIVEQNHLNNYLIRNTSLSNTGIMLALSTGIRLGELCALKWEDINFEKSIITVKNTVQRIKNTKGNSKTKIIITSPKTSTSEREIPLPKYIIPLLKEFRLQDDFYFLSGNAEPIEPRTMQYRFKAILKKADLPSVSFHSLRHMFATRCIEIGVDVKTLSEILGHSSVNITLNRYVHSSMKRKAECMQLFSDSLSR